MSHLKLPEIKADHRLSGEFEMPSDALERWNPEIRAAKEDVDTSISVYGAIGDTWDGNGVTARRISAALRAIGERDITVNVNSPGGDFFEGVAIYNLLREHKAKVTVNVLGLAASAGSIIAMAGDEIRMGEGTHLMIHNAWAVVVGNRHDLADSAEVMATFDGSMASLYAARTGLSSETVADMMDKETWLTPADAIRDGFATGMLSAADIKSDPKANSQQRAKALIDVAMAKAGHSRSVRKDVFKNLFSGTPGAADPPATPSAGTNEIAALLQSTIQTLKGQ
ncbi:Clp protease ClpP [Herbaspirillum sp. RU 5E]|nr:Clp protease ClpP [Herbaspirillum sp. RU 5E]